MEEKAILHFDVLGTFACQELQNGQIRPCTIPDKLGKKALSFLQYLVVNHRRNISAEELIEQFWPEEDSSNPANSLKNMMFKTRKLLSHIVPEQEKLLLTLQGCFAWNSDVRIELDSEEFETICLNVRNQSGEDYIEGLLRAAFLYKGDFLSGNDSDWAVSLRRYYQTLYLDVCKMVLPLLQEKERFVEMISICEQASGIGAPTDTFLVYQMQALLAMGQPEQAKGIYKTFREILWEEFEVEPSEQAEHLYTLAESMCRNQMDERDILKLVAEREVEAQAFLCTLGVFQRIVALEKRHLKRTDKDSVLLLVSLGNQVTPTTDARRLERILLEGLRTGDPIARLNADSYILMLTGVSLENARLVMERLDRAFHKTYSHSKARISFRAVTLKENNC